jgi:hypothetical protein
MAEPVGNGIRQSNKPSAFAAVVTLVVVLMSGPALAQTDSDGDGLGDDAEVSIYGTDPEVFDTDNDGLSDGVEVELGTDPLEDDTDGDGFKDSSEYLAGSDPLLATDWPYGVVITQVPAGESGSVVGQTPSTVSPDALAFNDSLTSGRSRLFPLYVSLAAAVAVGLAFSLALIPDAAEARNRD